MTVYLYDKNGNLVYVNTSRMMTDGHRDNSVGERKLIWDEENRLLSVCTIFAMPDEVLFDYYSNTKLSESSDMVKSWATFCCSGT